MNIVRQHSGFRKTLVSLAVITACAPVYAQDAEIAQLIRPESSVSIGAGAVSGDQRDRALFGQYNGMREHSGFVLFDADINKRDDANGTWMRLKGRNLGLDNRDLSFSHEKQGNWKYALDYSELVRHDPRTVNTGMLGAGSTTPTVVRLATPGSGADLDFKLKRVGLGLAGEKWINPNLQLEVSFKNEDKTGARRFGQGYDCARYGHAGYCSTAQNATNQTWALLPLAEPVDTTTRQLEARLNYHQQKLNVSAGYYGSFFSNDNGNVQATVPNRLNNPLGNLSTLSPAAVGGTSLQNVLQLPVALPPDNQAHQFYVSGNYAFTPTTRATFKYAYSHATQNEDFASMGLANAPAGVTNLGAKLDTTLLQFGLTARPLPKLSLLANLRYEDKDDKTPDALYNVQDTTFWNNNHVSTTKVVGKLEASYQLPAGLRGTVGLDYSSIERPVPTSVAEELVAGLGALRAKNHETGYRLELRRSMSETLTGAVGYTNSKRKGSDWTSLSTNAAFAAAGLGYGQTGSASQFIALNAANAFPMNMVDVDREKVKLSANWMPSEQFELQFVAENGKDKNATAFSPLALGRGWQESSTTLYSIDASFAMSEKWKINGYASQGKQDLKVNHSGYMADLDTRTDSVGLGVSGKPTGRLEMGAQLSYANDATKYGLGAMPGATGAAPSAANLAQVAIGLPDVRFQISSLNLFGRYTLDKKSSIRVNLIHQRAKLDEWSYGSNGTPFVYSDNTTVNMNQDQRVTFLGVAYIYSF